MHVGCLKSMYARLDVLMANIEFTPIVQDKHNESYIDSEKLEYAESDQELSQTECATIQESFEEWYCGLSSTAKTPIHEIDPMKARLRMHTEDYRVSVLTPFEENGARTPIDSFQEIITRTNAHTKRCVTGKSIKTFATSHVLEDNTPLLPDGLHVFDSPSSIKIVDDEALCQIKQLYQEQLTNRDPSILMYEASCNNNVILFYDAVKQKTRPGFKKVIETLRTKTPALAEYILIYCRHFMQLMDIDVKQLEKADLTLVYYPSKAGLNPHIDSIVPFEGTLGPILTIAMGTGIKMFDMLPSLEQDGVPVRVFLTPNQFMILDGMARATWSHGLPWNRDLEQWSIVLKFPELDVTNKSKREFVFRNGNDNPISTPIPFHLPPRRPDG